MGNEFYRGRFSFPGIEQPVAATYTLSHGTDPGRITIQCNPQRNTVFQNGPVTFWWQNNIVRIPDCRILSDRISLDGNGFITSVELEDYRWKWRYPIVDGRYNVRNAYQSIYGPTKKNPQQLARIILKSMGISNFNVAALPTDDFPFVEWYAANAANELSGIAERYGCRVVPWPDGRVNIFKIGEGDQLPQGLPKGTDSAGITSPAGPDRIEIHFGPSKYRVICALEPVGLDVDGSIKPIDELSYAPSKSVGGWRKGGDGEGINAHEVAGEFPKLQNLLKGEIITGPRRFIIDLARRSVFKWYRIKLEMPDGSKFHIPGYDKPISDVAQILPIDDRLLNVSLDPKNPSEIKDGEKDTDIFWDAYDQTVVWGIFFKKDYHCLNPRWPDLSAFRKREGENSYFAGGYSIDRERGIVMFDDYVYSLEDKSPDKPQDAKEGSDYGPPLFPELAISFMCSPRDVKEGIVPRYYVGRNRSDITPAGTRPLVITHPEFQLVVTFDLTSDGKVGPTRMINRKLLDKVGNYYIDAELRRYRKQNPRAIQYNGLWPIYPDGAIREVTFKMDPDNGMETIACYNDERNPYVLPYETRRRNQRVAANLATDRYAPPVFTVPPQTFPYNLGSTYISAQPSRR